MSFELWYKSKTFSLSPKCEIGELYLKIGERWMSELRNERMSELIETNSLIRSLADSLYKHSPADNL